MTLINIYVMVMFMNDLMSLLSGLSKYATIALQEDDNLSKNLIKSGKKVINLTIGDPATYFKTPEYIIEEYIGALRQHRTNYSGPLGVLELREAVAKRYKRMYRSDFTEEDVMVTQGVSEALMYLNATMIDKGDRSILFRPYFTPYLSYFKLYGGNEILECYREEERWGVDVDSLEAVLKRHTSKKIKIKYLIITNPNNPTGTVLGKKTLKRIVDIANDYDLLLISDEVYDEIVYNGVKFASISQFAKGVPHIILNGASKNYDSTGFRIGFVIIPEEDDISNEIKSKMKDFGSLRLSANTPSQYALVEGMNNVNQHKKAVGNMVREIEKKVNLMSEHINYSEYMDAVPPCGAFYIFPKINVKDLKMKDDKEFARRLLEEEYVQVARGSGFGEADHIRLVALAPTETLTLAIERIERFCKKHSRK